MRVERFILPLLVIPRLCTDALSMHIALSLHLSDAGLIARELEALIHELRHYCRRHWHERLWPPPPPKLAPRLLIVSLLPACGAAAAEACGAAAADSADSERASGCCRMMCHQHRTVSTATATPTGTIAAPQSCAAAAAAIAAFAAAVPQLCGRLLAERGRGARLSTVKGASSRRCRRRHHHRPAAAAPAPGRAGRACGEACDRSGTSLRVAATTRVHILPVSAVHCSAD
jgi:hypothetical protein